MVLCRRHCGLRALTEQVKFARLETNDCNVADDEAYVEGESPSGRRCGCTADKGMHVGLVVVVDERVVWRRRRRRRRCRGQKTQ